jgi:hypothetical protein
MNSGMETDVNGLVGFYRNWKKEGSMKKTGPGKFV